MKIMTYSSILRKVLSVSILFTLAFAAFPVMPSAYANGHNQVIFLAFLPDVSNFGNQSASGIAVVDLHTGEVSVQTTSLTPIVGGSYHIWLAGPNLESPVHVSKLESDGHLATIVANLPAQEYRYVVLSAEAEGEDSPSEWSDRVSLAGVFPNPEVIAPVEGLDSNGEVLPTVEVTDVTTGQVITATTRPPTETLPETGALLPDSWVRIGATILLASLTIAFVKRVSKSKGRAR